MFGYLESGNEAKLRELRRLTVDILKASSHGQFATVDDLRERRRRCLNALAADAHVMASAA